MDVPERVARNQAIFREVNERITEIGEQRQDESPLDLVCECSVAACAERVTVGAGDYEAVRSHPRRFIVAVGHLWHPEVEREVARVPEYIVLEKFDEAGDVAEETDPRDDEDDPG